MEVGEVRETTSVAPILADFWIISELIRPVVIKIPALGVKIMQQAEAGDLVEGIVTPDIFSGGSNFHSIAQDRGMYTPGQAVELLRFDEQSQQLIDLPGVMTSSFEKASIDRRGLIDSTAVMPPVQPDVCCQVVGFSVR